MLQEGRLPLTEAEHSAVDKLADQNPDAAISVTRRDPGETGPLFVHVGATTYQVDEAGHRKKVNS
jgi:hypothetical protein